jgi:hypothetical protein
MPRTQEGMEEKIPCNKCRDSCYSQINSLFRFETPPELHLSIASVGTDVLGKGQLLNAERDFQRPRPTGIRARLVT